MQKAGSSTANVARGVLVAMALGYGSLALAGTSALAQDAAAQAADSSQTAASSQTASRTDAQIQTDVEKQVQTAPGIAGQSIAASTRNGVVTLTGSVSDEVTRQIAENAVSGVAGVKSVENKLEVGGMPAPDAAPQTAAQNPPAQNLPANGTKGTDGWGPAGPPPDAVNGQVPPPPGPEADPDAAANPAGVPQPGPQPGTTYGAAPNAYPAYGQGGQYPNGSAPMRPQYQRPQQYQQAPPPPQYAQPSGPVTIPAGALVTVRLQNSIDARHLAPGDGFLVNVSRDVFQNGVLALPVGASLEGKVVAVKKPGAFAGGGFIQLQLTQLDLDGHVYPLSSDIFSTVTPGKGGQSAANTIGGAAFGALIGAAVGGGSGAAIGAVAGGGTGAAVSAASPGPRAFIPAEAMITFHLQTPLTLQPVSYQEATRLAATMPRGPVVVQPRRAYFPPPPGYYPAPY